MTPGNGTAHSYGFDASSNLTALPTGGTGRYDKNGELTSATLAGTSTSYSYNAAGERLSAVQGPARPRRVPGTGPRSSPPTTTRPGT
jgi:YD repeat-containing protein